MRQEVHDAARRARVAARTLATLSTATKNRALHAAADALLARTHDILAANAEDLDAARAAGTPGAMLDRLALDPKRVDGIAHGLRQVAGLPDPIGEQCCADARCPTACSCVSNGFRSVSSASSTKAGRT